MKQITAKVTAVIPVYNAEKYLDECIKSIVNQTYQNLEIIIVDDGSKDSSPKICDMWKEHDNRIKVIHKKNEGAGRSRNYGIKIATGQYIFFVDSDDYIKPTLVEDCVDAISKVNTNNATIVIYGVQNVDEYGTIINEKIPKSDKYIFTNKEIKEEFLPEFLFPNNKTNRSFVTAIMAQFYSLDIIKQTDWHFESEKDFFSEDLYSCLKLYQHIDKLIILDKALYCYRHGHESLSSSSRITNYDMIKKYYNQCLSLCKKCNYNKEVQKNISEPYLNFTIACLKLTAQQKKAINVKRKELNSVLKDELLHKILSERNVNYENKTKQILYRTILTKNYLLARILIYLKAYSDKN